MSQLGIAVLTTSFPRFAEDEAGIFVSHLVQALGRRALRTTVVVPLSSDEPAEEKLQSGKVCRYRYGLFMKGKLAFRAGILPNVRANPLLLGQAPLLLFMMFWTAFGQRKNYSLVHANWLPAAAAAWLLYLCTGKPYVITLRGEDVKLLRKKLVRWALYPALKKAAAITTVSKTFLWELESYSFLQNTPKEMISNGVAIPEIPVARKKKVLEKYNLEQAGEFFIFVGTVIPRKGIDFLLRAFSEAELSSFSLLVCGRVIDETYLQNLRDLAEQLGCSEQVIFLGATPPEDIPALLASSVAYVTASSFEGRPNSVLEAFAAKVPVLASAIEAHKELIIHGKNGLLFSKEDKQSFVDGALLLKNDYTVREAIVEAGFTFAKGLSWEHCAAAYENLFRSVVLRAE